MEMWGGEAGGSRRYGERQAECGEPAATCEAPPPRGGSAGSSKRAKQRHARSGAGEIAGGGDKVAPEVSREGETDPRRDPEKRGCGIEKAPRWPHRGGRE